jgi:hypothetical protein
MGNCVPGNNKAIKTSFAVKRLSTTKDQTFKSNIEKHYSILERINFLDFEVAYKVTSTMTGKIKTLVIIDKSTISRKNEFERDIDILLDLNLP